MKKNLKKVLAVVLALTMVFAMTATAFADTNNGYVTVSVMQNSFNLTGSYVGNGTGVAFQDEDGTSYTIVNFQVPISQVEENIEYGYKYLYLPEDVDDPMNGEASVLDAIIAALDMNGISDIDAGWDYTNVPAWNLYPGGYIHNINSDSRVGNTVTTYTDENGKVWNRSYGSGWSIAYSENNGTMIVPTQYTSNIALASGMNIIIDISAYDMLWE
ncbi:MAG: hypothetical protein ACI4LZ_10350 [Anaerovoracaceae bacterium]